MSGRGFDGFPAQNVSAKDGFESLRALAHDHAPAAVDRGGQSPHGVQERAHVGLRLSGQRVEN